MGGGDAVVRVEDLGRLAEGVARLQGSLVGLDDDGSLGELVFDPAQRRVHGALVEPEHDAQGEEVLGQVDLLGRHLETLERAGVEGRDGDLEERVVLERAVRQRVAGVAGLGQVAGREGIAVDDQGPARGQIHDVRLERGRVHGHEHVGLVARRVDLARREAQLEAAHAGQRAGRRPDLGREVGQRADVVAEDRRGARELGAGQLHAIARVAREPDGDAIELLDRSLRRTRDASRHAPSCSCRR